MDACLALCHICDHLHFLPEFSQMDHAPNWCFEMNRFVTGVRSPNQVILAVFQHENTKVPIS